LSTLKALKNSSNPDLLEIIHPLIQHGNSEVKLSSLTAYFKIVSNIVSADISLLLSSEDAEVKQAAYESLKEITKSFTDIEEMKNITLIDSDLEKINNSSLKENFSAKGNISELVNSIEKIEKNSNYSFISILSIFALLSIIIVSNFYLYRKNDTENLLSFSPPKSVIFSPETTLSNEARVNGLEEFTRGNFDTAERYFQLINDTHIKNYYLFKINMKKENFKEAAVFFLNLPEYSADNLEEYISLIKKLIENKDFNTAISVAEKIAYFNSSELNRLILSLYENQDIEKALYFEKITGAGNIDILKKGADYFKNKDFDKSSYYYERIINLLRTYNEKEPYIIALYELHKKYDKIDLFRDKLNRYLILFPESRKLSELNNSQFK